MPKLTNKEKIERVEKRKLLKVLIIIFASLTIIFSVLSLWKDINPLFAIIFFIIELVLTRLREKLDPKDK